MLWVLAQLNNQPVQRDKILAACNDPRSIQTESYPLTLILRQLAEREPRTIFLICAYIHDSFLRISTEGILTEKRPLRRPAPASSRRGYPEPDLDRQLRVTLTWQQSMTRLVLGMSGNRIVTFSMTAK